MPPAKKVLTVLFSMALLDQIAFGILLPILSLLFVDAESPYFLLDSSAEVRTKGYLLVSIAFAAFPFAQFFAGPVLGELSDKYGRKPILMGAALSITFAYGLFAVAVLTKNIPLLFLARILSGFGGGSVGAIFACAADISSTHDRAKHFGLIASAAGFGLIIGPALGGLLADHVILPYFNLMTPIYALLAFGVVNVALVSVWLPETNTHMHDKEIGWLTSFSHIRLSIADTKLRSVYFISFLFAACLSLFLTFGSVLLIQRFSLSQTALGFFLGYFGLGIAFTQLVIIPRAARIAPHAVVLRDGLMLCAVGFLMLFFAPSTQWLLIIAPILAIGIGLSYTMITTLLSSRGESARQGDVLGVNTSVQSLAQSIPALISGFAAMKLSAGAPIIAAALISLSAGACVFLSKRFYATEPPSRSL